MNNRPRISDEKFLYCLCPFCKSVRTKKKGRFNIIKRGYERNGLARFFCMNCQRWFNEKTGESMKWLERF